MAHSIVVVQNAQSTSCTTVTLRVAGCSARKLEKKLQLEKKQADHLMSKIMTADKPKFGKAAKAAARSPNGTAAAELSVAVDNSENSVGNRSPSLIPHIKNSAGTPNKPSGSRCASFHVVDNCARSVVGSFDGTGRLDLAAIATQEKASSEPTKVNFNLYTFKT